MTTYDPAQIHSCICNIEIKWAATWDFQQCGMCYQQSLRSAQSDQSLCSSLEYSMSVMLLTEHHLEFLSLEGGCTGLSCQNATLLEIPCCVFVAVFLGCASTGRVGLCFLWFYVQELPKAQPAVVLVLKRLKKMGQRLKVSSESHVAAHICLCCFVALRPKSSAMVIAGRSVHLTTLFPGQAWTSG